MDRFRINIHESFKSKSEKQIYGMYVVNRLEKQFNSVLKSVSLKQRQHALGSMLIILSSVLTLQQINNLNFDFQFQAISNLYCSL